VQPRTTRASIARTRAWPTRCSIDARRLCASRRLIQEHPLRNLAWFGLSLCVSIAAIGCNVGGLNDAIQQPGDQPGGVELSAGEIAVSPDGRFIVFEQDDALAMAWVDTGKVELLPVLSPARVAFSDKRSVVYVTTDVGETHAVDVETREAVWSAASAPGAMITVAKNDARLAVGAGNTVHLLSAADGARIAELELAEELVDLEILPDDRRLVALEREQWIEDVPHATLHVVDLEDGAAKKLDVENCADDLVVPVSGERALLAPTVCAAQGAGAHDPISHIDLAPGNERFVRNLPGFGPVAMSPDGTTAVGFLDMEALDASLFDDPSKIPDDAVRFHLMILDVATMTYSFEAYGPNLPRYAPTPNGEVLLVDEVAGMQAELFDVESRSFRDIEGLATLDQVSFSSDSTSAYVLTDPRWVGEFDSAESSENFYTSYELVRVDVPGATSAPLPTDFRPRSINISPDDSKLFLRIDDASVCIYSLERRSCDREIVLVSTLSSK
jgi:hypothetical protein